MTATTIRVQMAQRKDTAANWTAANPILLSGEIGYETDTKKFKIGNGSTNWNSLAYLPIPDGSGNLTITGNLEIGSTGSLTFEGSTADGFETTLAVTNPTADRTITLPNQSGTVLVSGNASIVDADIAANAEIAVSKLADGTARQLLQTDAAGTGVEWTSNIDVPGTLDVTSTATFDSIAQYPLGSAGAPTITFTGDNNTGIYSPGADQVAISTGGSPRVTVTSTGVGIGTTSPSQLLHVASALTTGGATPVTWSRSGGATGYLLVDGSGAGIYSGGALSDSGIYLVPNDRVSFSVNGSERFRCDSSGRLLVGTSSSASVSNSQYAKLQVHGNTFASTNQWGAFTLARTTSATSIVTDDPIGGILFTDVSGNEFASIITRADGNAGSGDYPGRIEFSTTADGASSPTERMRITSGGELLVGGTNDNGAYNIQCNGTGVWGFGAYVNGSDERLKENINPLPASLDVVKALNPVVFQYKPEFTADTSVQPGFIAQELQTALAGQVYVDGVVRAGGQYLNVAYQALIPVLTKALQEAIGEIELLKTRIADLERA